jgi:hypothetical protein
MAILESLEKFSLAGLFSSAVRESCIRLFWDEL